jgi:NADPH:quinone reductase-like Zn-dependent oxidoreductase
MLKGHHLLKFELNITGRLVIQLAKQAGMKVIASAGSEEKVEFMKEIGADVAFNYSMCPDPCTHFLRVINAETTDTREVLKKAGPIDV